MSQRFMDDFTRFSDFDPEVFVICPQCGKRSTLQHRGLSAVPQYVLTCGHCGYSKPGNEPSWVSRLELWLQTPCCGQVLWALNEKHLNWLEKYVAAALRERKQSPKFSWSNKSLASRLPLWMKQAKNREAVLAGVGRLRQRLR